MKKRSTKSALLLSALALLVSISMFVGSTFAWFTDSVSSVNNIIKSGNLDITVEYSLDGTNWLALGTNPIFSADDLWEPGHTVAAALRIKNVGSLAAKLDVATNVASEVAGVNVYGESFKLSDYLDVYALYMDGGAIGEALTAHYLTNREAVSGLTEIGFGTKFPTPSAVVLLPGEAQVGVLKITMPTTVGNVANHKQGAGNQPSITFGITVNATQQMHEEDSFGPDYDEDATFATPVATAAELADALANGEEVTLTSNIAVSDVIEVADGAVINLGGYTLDASANTSRPFNAAGDLTINANGAEIDCGAYGLVNIPAGVAADVVINGGTITANTDNGAMIKPRGGAEQNIVLNDVTYTDASNDGYIVNASTVGEDVEITINGGTYTAAFGVTVANKLTAKNATFNFLGAGLGNASDTYSTLIENCTINLNGNELSGSAPAAAVFASGNATVIVNNTTINAAGGNATAIYTSGGTISLTGCTVTGDYADYGNAGYPGAVNTTIVDGVIITPVMK